ncbi:MAG: nuclear transport factor 2 family protein [Planctomycetota bacterium]
MSDRYEDVPAEDRALADRFGAFFADFRPEGLAERARATYAPGVRFDDTLKRIEGLENLIPYLEESAAQVESCGVVMLDAARSGEDLYVRWRMTIRFKRFARDRDTVSEGMSRLRFDAEDRIVAHRDFWDSAGGFFQYVPVLGWMIRKIKARL